VRCRVKKKGKSQGNQGKQVRIKYEERTTKNPYGTGFSAAVPTGLGAHPASYIQGGSNMTGTNCDLFTHN
jgi:hypothetical protein